MTRQTVSLSLARRVSPRGQRSILGLVTYHAIVLTLLFRGHDFFNRRRFGLEFLGLVVGVIE